MSKILHVLDESLQVNKLRKMVHPELTKIGIGKMVGYCIFLSYFTLLPAIMKYIWPYLFHNFDCTHPII